MALQDALDILGRLRHGLDSSPATGPGGSAAMSGPSLMQLRMHAGNAAEAIQRAKALQQQEQAAWARLVEENEELRREVRRLALLADGTVQVGADYIDEHMAAYGPHDRHAFRGFSNEECSRVAVCLHLRTPSAVCPGAETLSCLHLLPRRLQSSSSVTHMLAASSSLRSALQRSVALSDSLREQLDASKAEQQGLVGRLEGLGGENGALREQLALALMQLEELTDIVHEQQQHQEQQQQQRRQQPQPQRQHNSPDIVVSAGEAASYDRRHTTLSATYRSREGSARSMDAPAAAAAAVNDTPAVGRLGSSMARSPGVVSAAFAATSLHEHALSEHGPGTARSTGAATDAVATELQATDPASNGMSRLLSELRSVSTVDGSSLGSPLSLDRIMQGSGVVVTEYRRAKAELRNAATQLHDLQMDLHVTQDKVRTWS